LAHIVADIADNFEKQNADETEKIILKSSEQSFVQSKKEEEKKYKFI